jgi:hypothetical protein
MAKVNQDFRAFRAGRFGRGLAGGCFFSRFFPNFTWTRAVVLFFAGALCVDFLMKSMISCFFQRDFSARLAAILLIGIPL